MNEIFKDVGIISNFNDLRFLFDKIESYCNNLDKLQDEIADLEDDRIYLENENESLERINNKLGKENNILKDKLKLAINTLENLIQDGCKICNSSKNCKIIKNVLEKIKLSEEKSIDFSFLEKK